MLKKLFSIFSSPKVQDQKKQNKSTDISGNVKEAKPKVQSTRIGELGEYKINIQLDQLPKGCKYLSDLMLANSKSRTGYFAN